MLKLPLCPYCGARFLYPEVKKSRNKKSGVCPNCGKTFRIYSRTGRAVLYALSSFFLVGLDFFLLTIPAMNLTFLLAVTAAGVAGIRLLNPYTVRYGPDA
ncbi:hypothetical protein EQM14_00035 [Caproiciproducens sp. NJN-50]|uniref:hypothetical protein n=1 Tax=Acutalibacteraceae TaxID=3082771 RepID=UPI000FFE29A4|nr:MULTISPECIES: hypothetical protein [Acutalibacteraceae]QAT48290.1 hypothetical protein EQM14_00035 [Caproiciproducens sp. NJN-50]